MGVPTNVPPMLQESVYDCIGRKTKVNFLALMQYEVKPEKFENRVLVLTNYRLLLLTTKTPGTKIDASKHFFDIKAIETRASNKVVITTDTSRLVLFEAEQGRTDVDHIVQQICELIVNVLPGKPVEGVIPRLEISPSSRLKGMSGKLKEASEKEPGPCGGFSAVYKCMCDYHGQPFMEEVAWDIDTIYLSHDTKELNLGDFDHLNSKHLVPVISALQYNQWFTGLNGNNIKFTNEAVREVISVMKSNSSIETLKLSNVGAKADFADKLSMALLSNEGSALTSLDLSNNPLGDKGISSLCAHLNKHSRGLTSLNLSKTSLSSAGVAKLAEALCGNKFFSTTLKTLDISDNNVKGEDMSALHNFFAKPNALTHLNLSGMECALESIFGAFKRGCCQNLSQLNLSRNVFSRKFKPDQMVPHAWKEFCNCALSLKSVNMSECKLPAEAVKHILLGLGTNSHARDLELNLSSCSLGYHGAQVLEVCLPSVNTISSLDISDNGFDNDLVGLLGKISQNKCIKRLSIGRNMNNIKPKNIPNVMDALVQVIHEGCSAIEALSLQDSKLKSDIAVLINSLGSNSTLGELNISGNQMGDAGARMLAKALLINNKIHTIFWDYNNTTPNGFHDIATALENNHTLKKMPTPIYDSSVALRLDPEKTHRALAGIETLLQRNHSPRKFASDQAYRLQQGFLIGSSQQFLDQVVVSLQDTMSSLKKGSVSDRVQKDIDSATSLIKESDSTRQLLPRLQEVALRSEGEDSILSSQLKQISADLQKALQQQLNKSLRGMMAAAKEKCPVIMEDEALYKEVQTSCSEKAEIPKNYTEELVTSQIGTELANKISEMNLSIAANMSDKMMDGVIETLENNQQTLTRHLIAGAGREEEEREERKSLLRLKKEKEEEEEESLDTIIPPEDTKFSTLKRQSLYNRIRRPQSTLVPSLPDLFDKDDQTDSTPDASDGASTPASLASREGTPVIEKKAPPARSKSESAEAMDDLPALEPTPRLAHLGAHRPKRHKTHAAKRPVVKPDNIISEDKDEQEVEAAMDDFFASKPVAKEVVVPTVTKNNALNKRQDSVEKEPPKADKKKGWSPFGGDAKGLAAGIGNFFNKDKKKSPTHVAKPQPSPEPTKPEPAKAQPLRRSAERSFDKEESPKRDNDVTEKNDTETETPKAAPRGGAPRMAIPMMGPGIGAKGGADLLAELRKKRETLSPKNEEPPSRTSILKPSKSGTLEPPKRPIPAARSSSPASDDVDGKGPAKPAPALSKPRAPPRPPPKPAGKKPVVPTSGSPTPGSRPSSGTTPPTAPPKPDPDDESSSPRSGTPTRDSDKVIDTGGKKRLSVRDRTAMLDKNSNEQNPVLPAGKGRAVTLPRDSDPPKSGDPPLRSLSAGNHGNKKEEKPDSHAPLRSVKSSDDKLETSSNGELESRNSWL